MKQALKTLEFAHSKEWAHIDISYSNLMIHQNEIIIIDWGMANINYHYQCYILAQFDHCYPLH
jgi:serine/threonine protein kinase